MMRSVRKEKLAQQIHKMTANGLDFDRQKHHRLFLQNPKDTDSGVSKESKEKNPRRRTHPRR